MAHRVAAMLLAVTQLNGPAPPAELAFEAAVGDFRAAENSPGNRDTTESRIALAFDSLCEALAEARGNR